jgi:uncharacterized repeat protein (TIGR03803 family)
MAFVLALAGLILPGFAGAQGLVVIHNFQSVGGDGWIPSGNLLRDSAGNLYGTTALGGDVRNCKDGCGTVFKLAPDGTETILHAFDYTGGAYPLGGVIMGRNGNLYGTTLTGANGCGTVYELAPDGTETTLNSFTYGAGGCRPSGGLLTHKGDLYGTTTVGGNTGPGCGGGCGVVFRLARDGVQTVLWSFAGGSDGSYPSGNLVMDTAGNLYGTTYEGGGTCGSYGCGTIYMLAPDGTETILHAFDGTDGVGPLGGVIMDSANNLYGTTDGGGTYGYGTIFKLAADGTETVLYSFGGGSDGGVPSSLLLSKSGNLYGTTSFGGLCCGTVFKLAPDGTKTVLHEFKKIEGISPDGLIAGGSGMLYGTAERGGNGTSCKGRPSGKGCGTVFMLKE